MKKEIVAGIEYSRPEVFLFQETGIGVAEFAARTAYDSFENSENEVVKNLKHLVDKTLIITADENTSEMIKRNTIKDVNDIEESALLDQLAWVHHHHSVIEHSVLSFYIKGTSRGVLQEHARHRIQSITVRSTRYTMSDIVNAFITAISVFEDECEAYQWFEEKLLELDIFVTTDVDYNKLQINDIYDKMMFQLNRMIETHDDGLLEFNKMCLSKENLEYIAHVGPEDSPNSVYINLKTGKKKRNVGDPFKHIVNDNWKVDMVITFNLRSLKNYFDLRDSGAAYFQIKWLAEEMKKVIPEKYLKLIIKEYRNKDK